MLPLHHRITPTTPLPDQFSATSSTLSEHFSGCLIHLYSLRYQCVSDFPRQQVIITWLPLCCHFSTTLCHHLANTLLLFSPHTLPLCYHLRPQSYHVVTTLAPNVATLLPLSPPALPLCYHFSPKRYHCVTILLPLLLPA